MVIFAVETEKVAFHLVERKLSEIHIKKSVWACHWYLKLDIIVYFSFL